MTLNFLDLGLIDYEKALEQQLFLVNEVIAVPEKETVIFCSHPPVVTLGKKSQPTDVGLWQGQVVPVQRGGRVTYHGPGQVVAYPILHLGNRDRDIYKFLRGMEKSVIAALKYFGVEAQENIITEEDKSGTGVWVGNRKIASIGVAVKRWVSYHGVAINLHKDPLAFTGINPCGFSTDTMISLEEILGEKISHEQFQNQLKIFFNQYFSF